MAADAGVAVQHRTGRNRRSSDVRTALLTAFPENRGTHILEGWAAVTRRVPGEVNPEAWLEGSLARNGFRRLPSDAGVAAVRAPFLLRAGPGWASASMELTDTDVARLYSAPAGTSSQFLALMLPNPPGDEWTDEFVVYLQYEAFPSRAAFLAFQVAELAANAQWKFESMSPGVVTQRTEDGGIPELPTAFDYVLREPSLGAQIKVQRSDGTVTLEYRLTVDQKAGADAGR